MADRITVGQLYPNAIPPVKPGSRTGSPAQTSAGARTFQDVFHESLVKLSHHAEVRLQQRGIELKPEQMAKIQTAIENAEAKGARESLLLIDNMAMIVNVKNKTIVTALDGAAMKNNVFTQIDSAVVIS